MKNIKRITILFMGALFVLSFVSCKKEINLNLHPSVPQIVIEGKIPLDSLMSVQITQSKNFNEDNTYPAVNGAVVTISDNKGNTEILTQNSLGIYTSKRMKGEEGVTYNLDVEVKGVTYTATSKLPTYVPIDTVTMLNIAALNATFPLVRLKDPAGEPNYYRYIFAINGRTMPVVIVASDEYRDGTEITQPLTFDQQADNNGQDIQQGDTIDVELQSIDKGAYTFFDTLSQINQNLANPTTNIQGGALGYFSAYATSTKRVIASWN